MQLPLHPLSGSEGHVVAQVIEAELVVGAVGNVGQVSLGAGYRAQKGQPAAGDFRIVDKGGIVLETAHAQPQSVIDRPHPHRVAAGQVVVDGDHVNAAAGQRIGVHCQSSHQRLALAGSHLGNLALMQGRAADDLHVVMALAQIAAGRFTHSGKGFGQQPADGLPALQPLPELGSLGEQLFVAQTLKLRLQPVDRFLDGGQLLQGLFVGVAYYLLKNGDHRSLSCCKSYGPRLYGY